MNGEASGGRAAATASLLYTEAIVERLRRRGFLDAEDIRRALIAATAEAQKLPENLISRYRVVDVLAALRTRADRRLDKQKRW